MKQKITIAFILTIISITIFWACKEEDLPEIPSNNKIELTIIEDSTSYVFSEITCNFNQLPNFTIEQHGFCWDTIASVNIEKQSNALVNLTNQTFQETIEELLPNTTYYVKSYIQNGDIIIYSNELMVQTLDARPNVSTSDITNILAKSAESGGIADAYEVLFPITQRGICWAKTQNPNIADSLTINGTGNGTFTSQLQHLDIGINYYVKAYAINSEGISYGEEKSFSALDGIPNLTTDSIRNITATSATFYGNIIENDGLEILEKGFCWNTSTNPTLANYSQTVTGNTLGSFNVDITGVEINTTYYIKSYLKNSEGTFYGNEINFKTEDGLPILATTTISNITATSASTGGNITDDGGFAISAHGVCWSTMSNPTITDNHTTDGTGTGNFTSNITGLNVSTTYYVKAYATNSNGTVYGEEYNFTTEDGLAEISTITISDITVNSAESGGIISDDGGFNITARGVCWSKIVGPTIYNDTTHNGYGIGSFVSNLKRLDINSTYYLRAYATNENGTVYGNEISFTTKNSVEDIDGNSYQIVMISNQIWMSENLKTTHYSDGRVLFDGTGVGDIQGDYTSKYYFALDDNINNIATYGLLYTWAAAMDGNGSSSNNPSEIQGACPDGWHIPSDVEWDVLATYISVDNGGYTQTDGNWEYVGGHLKATSGWPSNGNGTDTYGFNGMPSGSRVYTGTYTNTGASFWSTTEYSSDYIWKRGLGYNNLTFHRIYDSKAGAFSIRCIKD